ncbi:MAG: hypothetical protein ABI083_15375 [Lapillicoccus sp.]
MSAPFLSVLAQAEAARELPMPPYAFALIAFGAFLLGLGVLWSFRNTAAKVASKQRPGSSGGQGSSHGSGPANGQGHP